MRNDDQGHVGRTDQGGGRTLVKGVGVGLLLLGLLNLVRHLMEETGSPVAATRTSAEVDPDPREGFEAPSPLPVGPRRESTEPSRVETDVSPPSPAKVRFGQRTELEVVFLESRSLIESSPVPDAAVFVWSMHRGSPRASWTGKTGPEGTIRFGEVPVGETYIEVAGRPRRFLTVEPGIVNRVVFRRVGGVTVEGTVVDVDGQGVGGAKILVSYKFNGGGQLPAPGAGER